MPRAKNTDDEPTVEHERIELAMPPLLPVDRCDRCGAQAYVRIMVGYLDVLLCGHDYKKHAEHVVMAGYGVHDERENLLNRYKGELSS
jgi:hypothetical protein